MAIKPKICKVCGNGEEGTTFEPGRRVCKVCRHGLYKRPETLARISEALKLKRRSPEYLAEKEMRAQMFAQLRREKSLARREKALNSPAQVRFCAKCGGVKTPQRDICKSSGIGYKCKSCVNASRRGRVLTPEQRELKRAKDRRFKPKKENRQIVEQKRRESEKHKEWKEQYYSAKRAKRIAERVSSNIGAMCVVTPVACAKCGKNEVRRGDLSHRPIGARFCSEHSKVNAVTGLIISIRQVQCRKCGSQYDGKHRNKMCPTCALSSIREKQRAYRRAQPRKDDRVRKYGAIRIPFRRKDVFERDRYRCRMCGCATQKHSIYLPDAAELDHIIPLSKGGAHALYNMQTLCRRCNAIKSDRVLYACTYTEVQRYEYDSDVSDVMYGSDPCRPCYQPALINPQDISPQNRRTSHAQAHAANKVSHL